MGFSWGLRAGSTAAKLLVVIALLGLHIATDAQEPSGCSSAYVPNPPITISPKVNAVASVNLKGCATTSLNRFQLEVRVTLKHPYMGDLSISLFNPNNFGITLVYRKGGSLDMDGTYVFRMDAARSIKNASTYGVNGLLPPGIYRPESSFDATEGISPNGIWTVKIWDEATMARDSSKIYQLRGIEIKIGNVTKPSTPPPPVAKTCSAYKSPSPPSVIPVRTALRTTASLSGCSVTSLTSAQIEVRVTLAHPLMADLALSLYSPTNKSLTLVYRRGCSVAGALGLSGEYVFRMDAAKAIRDAATLGSSGSGSGSLLLPPGAYRPESSFDLFAGINPAGTWRLEIYDEGGVPRDPTKVYELRKFEVVVGTLGALPPSSSLPPPSPPPMSWPSAPKGWCAAASKAPPQGFADGTSLSLTADSSACDYEVVSSIAEVVVRVALTHGNLSDLRITLSYSGRTAWLVDFQWATKMRLDGTYEFHMEDGMDLWTATDGGNKSGLLPPAVYQAEALSYFYAQGPRGVWTLGVADKGGGSGGGSVRGFQVLIKDRQAVDEELPWDACTGYYQYDTVAMPDFGALELPLWTGSCPGGWGLKSLVVYVDMEHHYMSDVRLSVIAPNGVEQNLIQNAGEGLHMLGRYEFRMNATKTVDEAFNDQGYDGGYFLKQGAYIPDGNFAVYYGMEPSGTWTLRAVDYDAGDAGIIFGWGIWVDV
ncbi:hypothetical protein HYH03_010053 [Edaphochlamys debaryana]|uniref:P/Homo B domain-containing protein n=1 Tax=Edaphochlamys debaryana TaxID=47281 RepID=A0A835XXH5_9CHLO|nr:hypothetical protein HYH03_010053 [Edaphochlamys debaryana]|eukprot:KAG2491685.1 hypothetical protein HYH03_010053 [Edaphochlamys debaryana]